MAQPLILRHEDWTGLIAELATHEGFSYLRGTPLPVATAVLAAPAAIARWIALRSPELAAAPTLDILVIGAETTDAPDQGRWYQLIPQFLDAHCKARVTLIGPELHIGFTSSAAVRAPAAMAYRDCVTLEEFLSRNTASSFDLAAVFHPGLQKHRDWLAESGFPQLIAAGVPVIGSSYEVDEYEMDRWVLECYGYRASAEPVLNPFVLELGDDKTSVRWGRALWRVESAPPAGATIDVERLNALDVLTQMVMHSITEVRIPSPAYGAQLELQASDGGSMQLVHIFDQRFVDISTGSVLVLTPAGQLHETGIIPADELERYPGPAARDIDRAVWAADIKSRHLLASYPRLAEVVDTKVAARGILAAMRAKAARLFR